MKTIAVSGAGGFIGRWFIKMYGAQYHILALTRGGGKPPAGGVAEFVQTGYEAAALPGLLKGCDAFVHLAARKVEPGAPETFETYAENAVLTERLLIACRDAGVTNFINMSSRCVYGPGNALPFDEGQPVRPINMYGVSKAAGELVCDYCNRYRGMNAKSLRLSQVTGDMNGGASMFNVFVRQAANGRELNVFGEGKGKRDYIYVKDVCRAIALSVERPEERGVYNVASGTGVSSTELAEAVCDAFGNTGNIRMRPDKPADESVIVLSTEKARRELSFGCKFTLEDALVDIKRMIDSGEMEL